MCSLDASYGAGIENGSLTTKSIRFYGYFSGKEGEAIYIKDKEIPMRTGVTQRLVFSEYVPLDGVTPETIDIETIIFNGTKTALTDVKIELAMIPKVAAIVRIEDFPDAIDEAETIANARWVGPVIKEAKLVKHIEAGATKEIVFEKINLGKIIDGYFNKNKWPVEIKATILVDKHKTSKSMKIDFEPY